VPTDAEISWISPIQLDYVAAMADEAQLLKILRKQLRDAIASQGFSAVDLARCVYVVRMGGPFIVAYPCADSPVLYVGRGNAPSRLASHLGKWLHAAHKFGSGVGIELRICVPRRRKRADFFKCVEADLIGWFQAKYGAIPFFNSRREPKWEGCVDYNPTSEADLRRALGVGRGNRPQWAIRPLPSNTTHDVYQKGIDPSIFA
jgi:hypothetical protein